MSDVSEESMEDGDSDLVRVRNINVCVIEWFILQSDTEETSKEDLQQEEENDQNDMDIFSPIKPLQNPNVKRLRLPTI